MKPCRCLLRELGPEDYFKNVYDYIASLDPERRAPRAEAERRLALCLACPRLQNGMCALCGCFVEVRAALRQNRCADTPPKW